MSRYDGLIIPRSYSDYLNKTDGATLSQMLDSLGGTLDAAPTANSAKAARSGGIFASNAVITSDNATLTGVAISAGSVVRVLFTAALTGSDATTGLNLTYNGNTYAVKVGKNGALANFLANNIDGSYTYCQAYTTLELMFDGSQFIIMGNPVVISSADYTIYTDGTKDFTNKKIIQGAYEITQSVNIASGGIYRSSSFGGQNITTGFNRLLSAIYWAESAGSYCFCAENGLPTSVSKLAQLVLLAGVSGTYTTTIHYILIGE